MCMPSPGTTSEGNCAESWNCAVSDASTLSHSSGSSGCRQAGPVIANLRGYPRLRFMHRRGNLEDLFLKLTGREMRE